MKFQNTIAIGYPKAEDDININSRLDKAEIVRRIQQAYATGQLMVDLTGVKDDGLYLINLGLVREINVWPYEG